MDHALATRMIRVKRADGPGLDGEVMLGAREETWSFVAARAGRAGSRRRVEPARIEELAGNNVGRAFDVEVLADVHRRSKPPRSRSCLRSKDLLALRRRSALVWGSDAILVFDSNPDGCVRRAARCG